MGSAAAASAASVGSEAAAVGDRSVGDGVWVLADGGVSGAAGGVSGAAGDGLATGHVVPLKSMNTGLFQVRHRPPHTHTQGLRHFLFDVFRCSCMWKNGCDLPPPSVDDAKASFCVFVCLSLVMDDPTCCT